MSLQQPGMVRRGSAFISPNGQRPGCRPTGGWVECLEGRQLLSAATAWAIPWLAGGASRLTPATVTTNKHDYRPGERAVIRGSGFLPGEAVRLQVLHTDGTPNTAPEHRPWVVRAGGDGKFRTVYLVGADDLNTALRVTATGALSHATARRAFTDSAPSNDNFSARATLTGTSITASGTNVGATKEAGETNHAGNSGGHSVWWTWTAPSAGTVTIDTGGSSFDTLLAVYTGTSVSSLSGVSGGANDDSPAGGTNTSKVTFPVVAGTAYQIAVDGFGGATGTVALHLKLTAPLNLASKTSVTSNVGSPGGTLARPDHIVVVVEEDRAAGALGDANMPYFNSLASGGLVFSNSHGVNNEADDGEMNYLALYSGSTQGILDDGRDYSWSGSNLAKSLFAAGRTLAGYSESLPADGSQVTETADPSVDPDNHPDAYIRAYNPMAQFTDVGPTHTNADVNKTFKSFPTAAAGFASLPTVSFVIPDMFHNTHGSNESPYTAASSDFTTLRANADSWLKNNLSAYAAWAKQNNSLLIVTGDEGDRGDPNSGRPDNFAKGVTTIISGDSRLVVPGTDSNPVNPYSILRTVENMYGLSPLGNSANTAALDTDASGRLAPQSASGQPTVSGQSVTFTAGVAPAAANSTIATGTVQFKIDGANFGGPVALINGSATSQAIGTLAVGGHTVTASYSGDATYAASTSASFAHTVNQAKTATTLSSSANPAALGQSVTLTAAVKALAPGAGTPTASVTFMDGNNSLGSVSLDATGHAALSTAALSAGAHSLTAVYAGDASDAGSTSATLVQTVNDSGTVTAGTTTTLTSSANPSAFGGAVTFTATVAPAGSSAATPSGTVTFTDGSVTLGTVALGANGQATLTTSTLGAGSHAVSASYSGDGNFAGSATGQPLSQVVNPGGTTTTLVSSANPASAGQSVTFTATVVPVAGTPAGAAAPTRAVQFKIDGANFGSPITLVNGSATSPATTSLSGGSHSVSAVYSGDGNYTTSTAPTLTQAIGPANDNFANRAALTTVSATSFTATGTNVGATKEPGEPNHAGNAGGHSLWWWYEPSTPGTVTLDTLGSSFDTLLAVYTGSTVSTLTAVPNGSNDDSPAGGTMTSKVTFSVTAGTYYKIAVDGYAGATGSISLHLSQTIAPPAAPTAVSASDGAYTDHVHDSWTASANATGYDVYRATANKTGSAVKIGSVTSTSYDDYSAVHGTVYYYWVKAKNAGGTSGFSSSNSGYR